MAKIAAQNLQMPIEKIKFMLGDTDYPPGPGQGGSSTTSSLGTAVNLVCETLKKSLKDLAIEKSEVFKNVAIADLDVQHENVISIKDAVIKIAIPDLMKLAGKQTIEIVKDSPGNNPQEVKHATFSFSVHFVKVYVHPKTGAIQIKQIITTGDAGKIISENTARSQMLGGAVGGIGMALKEELIVDHQTGEVSNASFGTYHVPLHTDIAPIDVWFVNKPDPFINPIGAKGLGEIALIGFAAAVANAVYNATGKRVRDLPITPQKLGFKA
jgi:xanthine dehydrogenase YagR molybdenum-binding subunit